MNMGNKSRRKLNINILKDNIMANSNKNLFKRNIIMVNKKLIFGVLLTFLVCIGSAILASYMTNPVDPSLKYPNPGHYPGEIGPGTFNCSETTGCYFEFPDDSGATGLMIYNGSTYVYKTLSIFDYPLYFNPNDDDWVVFFAEKGTGAKFPGMKIYTYDGSNWRTPFEVSPDDYITIGDDGYIYIWLKNDVGINGDLNVSGTIKRTGYVKGDCDKNGVVNLKDVQCIDDYTNGLNTNCDEADVDCDINDDGLVDFMHDVLILGRILTGAYNAIDYLPFDSIASISPYAKFEAYENMPAIKADATGSTAYSGFFTGGKGVKIEGDLNVSGGIERPNYKWIEGEHVYNWFGPPITLGELATKIESFDGTGNVGDVSLWTGTEYKSYVPGVPLNSDVVVNPGSIIWINVINGYKKGMLPVNYAPGWHLHTNGNLIVDDNVGIGTISPSEKLEVNGSVKIEGDLDVTGSIKIDGNKVVPGPFIIYSSCPDGTSCTSYCSSNGHTCAFGQRLEEPSVYHLCSCDVTEGDRVCMCWND